MSVFDSAQRVTFNVTPGTPVLRIPGLSSGTMYAVYMKPLCGSRVGSLVVPATPGPGGSAVALGTLPAASQTILSGYRTDTMAAAYPAGVFIAGASAAYSRVVPQFSVDSASSSDVNRVLRLAAPDFNHPTDVGVNYIEVRVSRDGGSAYPEVVQLTTPFPNNLNYAVVSVPVPYETEVSIVGQTFFKDGTAGRTSRPLILRGFAKPDHNTLSAPVINSATGSLSYSSATNTVRLTLTVVATPDPNGDGVQIRIVNPGDGSVKDAKIISAGNDRTLPLTAVFDNLDATISSYTVYASSQQFGTASREISTTFTTPAASTYKPSMITPASVNCSEVIEKAQVGGLVSKIKVLWTADASQPKANIYIRRRDNFGGDANSFTGFNLAGSSSTCSFLTDPVVAGSAVTWDVVVLAVGVTGTEAAFTSAQIKTVAIQQYNNYTPTIQAVPTVTVVGLDQLSITGSYTRPNNTPAPTFINVYKSETAIDSANLVGQIPVLISSDPTIYNWRYDVASIAKLFSTGTSYITLRVALENGFLSSDAAKTVIKTISSAPGTVPTLASATAYVKTVGASISNCTSVFSASSVGYTPASGGNGSAITLTPAYNDVIIEVSDGGGTPGINTELITPQSDKNTPLMWLTFAPSKNTGNRNIRAKFNTPNGQSGFSSAIQVTFPADNPVDSTVPDLTNTTPRFVLNADGTITLNWVSAVFGTSGLGSYTIRRNTADNSTTSVVVGTVTTTPVSSWSWTDYYTKDNPNTYYYWLEATSGQNVKSASPKQFYATSDGTTHGAVATDAAPAVPTGLVVVGTSGGFNLVWDPNTERDLSYYSLEYSALGTFADTVTVKVSSPAYFQSLGALGSAATAAAYRWRVKAVDRAGNASAVCTAVAANLTNYVSLLDPTPTNLTSVTGVTNGDGSITLTITPPADSARGYFQIIRRSNPTTFVDGAAATTEATLVIPNNGAATAVVWTDSGLNPNSYYSYRVYGRSKLGTLSAGYVSSLALTVNYAMQGTIRPNLISNGHFGTAGGAFGSSITAWTLGGSVATVLPHGSFTYAGTLFQTPSFTRAVGGTSGVMVSQTFQVVPGKRYTVLGMVHYAPTTADGNAYIRVVGAGTLSDASGGALIPPAPYPNTPEVSGTDVTSVIAQYRFISYSFVAPSGSSTMTLNIGYENRVATDQVRLFPQFIQVFQDH